GSVRRRPRVGDDHHRSAGWDAVAMNQMRVGFGDKPMSIKSFRPLLPSRVAVVERSDTTGEPPTRPRPASLGNAAAATRLRFISHLRARRRVRGSGIVRTEMLID